MIDASKVKQYIRGNLRGTLCVKEISVAFQKDPSDIDRAFRTAEGVPIKPYVDHELKEEAVRLMRGDGFKGYDIGRRLGFPSDQAFYRWAKRVFKAKYSSLPHGSNDQNQEDPS